MDGDGLLRVELSVEQAPDAFVLLWRPGAIRVLLSSDVVIV
jgi:hypothetical protein